jgi:glutathione S-transferase
MTPMKLYALVTIILFFKMSAISIVQGVARTRANAFAIPEEAKLFGGTAVREEVPMVQRASRAWGNDLENIPIFLFLALIHTLSSSSLGLAPIYFTVFVIARIAHTFFYLNAMQPWRTIAYTIGALATLALAINIISAVILGP